MKNNNTEYKKIYEKYSPLSKTPMNMVWAFVVGGAICALAQLIKNAYLYFGMTEKASATALPITMVFLGVLFTVLGLYKKLAKRAGAGTIVPITGFANSIASAAVEFKPEGLVFGTCVKMFTIAGPVIVFGVSASVLYGLILCILK